MTNKDETIGIESIDALRRGDDATFDQFVDAVFTLSKKLHKANNGAEPTEMLLATRSHEDDGVNLSVTATTANDAGEVEGGIAPNDRMEIAAQIMLTSSRESARNNDPALGVVGAFGVLAEHALQIVSGMDQSDESVKISGTFLDTLTELLAAATVEFMKLEGIDFGTSEREVH